MRYRKTYLSLLILLASFIDLPAYSQNDTNKTFYNKAIKEYHYGIPFLYLEGNDYEVGLQYGSLLKKELNELYIGFNDYKDKMMSREFKYLPWYKRFPAKILGPVVFNRKIKKLANKLPDDLNKQLKGMAKGSGLPIRFFYESNLWGDFLAHGCSSFIIKKNGKTYHFRNLDSDPSELANFAVVANYKITGKQKYTNIGFVSSLIITTGFNESGISFSENTNGNPKSFEKSNSNLLVERNRIITESYNLRQVDSIVNKLKIPSAYIFTIASSKEFKANIYDVIGAEKAITPVGQYQYVANRTISKSLLKKSELIKNSVFGNTAREIKFSELIDTTKENIIDHGIDILSNSDFYHYTGLLSGRAGTLNNDRTLQSVAFDLSDSSVYIAYNTGFAASGRWLKYNYITRKVSVYKEPNTKNEIAFDAKFKDISIDFENLDWRDSTSIRNLVNKIESSKIESFYLLQFLSWRYLNTFKMPSKAMIYANRLITKFPDIESGYYLKGYILEKQNKYNEAIIEYKKALDCKINCDYNMALAYERLAFTYVNLGSNVYAKEYAIKALEINNQYWIPLWFNEKIDKLNEIAKKGKLQNEN